MPGEPVETMIGTGLMGFGVILAYGAYKNVNPLEIIRQFITTGKFVDPNKLPKLIGSTGADAASKAALEAQIVAGIKPKNADLANRAGKALEAYFNSPSSTTQSALQSIIDEMKSKGFTKEASLAQAWLNANPPSSFSSGTVTPASATTQPVDVPSGADFGTTSGVGNLVFDPSTGNWVVPTT